MSFYQHLKNIIINGDEGWDRFYDDYPLVQKLITALGLSILVSIPLMFGFFELISNI